jgi:hypothetical protein
MTNLKHSKFKNTGLLYELLARQLTIDVLNANESNALKLISKHFGKNTVLSKELQLYNYLLSEKVKGDASAMQFADAIVKMHDGLNRKQVNRAKYELIRDIRESFDIDSFFSYRIENYKILASIYKLFEYKMADNPVELVRTKALLVEHVQNKRSAETRDMFSNIPPEFKDKDIRLLTYKVLIEKFNRKYNNALMSEQKELLREYIHSITNTPELKERINAHVDSIKRQLKALIPGVESKVMRIKLNEVVKILDVIRGKRHVNDEQISTILNYYELIKELKHKE